MSTASTAVPDHSEAELAREALRNIRDYLAHGGPLPEDAPVKLKVADDPDEVLVPKSVLDLIVRVLAHMSAGQGVTVIPQHAELTTQQAADLLNVSRPHLIPLLETAPIEYRMVGTHRRILASSLLEYLHADDLRRREAADELSKMTRELGLA
jgi:excisionase family DNA binding protein